MTTQKIFIRILPALVALCGLAANEAPITCASLTKDLQSASTPLRVRARQLLPRYGVVALDGLLPLLANEDLGIRLTAYNVVADISNGAASPGHDADRQVALTQLITLIAPAQPELVKLQGLRLLPIVVPAGFDVAPIAALFADENLREKARECLGQIPTDNASDAMVDAAAKADPAFASALLDGVALLKKTKSLERAAALTKSDDPGVRNAAARAVAWSGNPDYLPLLRDVVAKATPESKTDAFDALLKLADAMVLNGGNWDKSIGVYKEVLKSANKNTIRAAAMMGLGRYGDATVVAPIVDAAKSGNGVLDDTAAMALAALQGKEGVEAALAVYPNLPVDTRISMLSLWGQRKQPEAADIAVKELGNSDKTIRTAALHAVSNIGSAKAFGALIDVAKSGSDEEKQFALGAVKQMAGNLGGTGDKNAAGAAYVQLYGLTQDEALRSDALRGMAQYPVPQAFDAAKDALGQPNLKPLAIEALASVAGALSANKESAKAVEAVKLVKDSGAPTDVLIRMASALQGADLPPEIANLLGTVRAWQVIGPFDWKDDSSWTTAYVGEPNVDPTKPVKAGDAELPWKPATGGGPTGVVDLLGAIGQHEHCFGYGYAVVDVAEESDGQIRMGSDDGGQIWLNGKQVLENRADRGAALDQDKADVHFVKGKNIILVKISQGGGGWNFMLRLTKPDGAGITFTQP